MFGRFVALNGNIPQIAEIHKGTNIVSFPTKHHWIEKSTYKLIKMSADGILALANLLKWNTIISTRPGCGNGQLEWHTVKQILDTVFDNRFMVITPKE
jgi:hypothetical protein